MTSLSCIRVTRTLVDGLSKPFMPPSLPWRDGSIHRIFDAFVSLYQTFESSQLHQYKAKLYRIMALKCPQLALSNYIDFIAKTSICTKGGAVVCSRSRNNASHAC